MAVTGELELAVMEILWSRPVRLSVREVHELLSADRDLAYTTVMTVLDRLAKKGLVLRKLEGRAWLYFPTKSRADEAASEVRELLSRLSLAERTQVLAQLNSTAVC
ncbi:MAG TPA: BlaI/MecI/CopY family transcriptional regulator [Propionicimonas sp.]|nr:BlaI/MecI/CopY family transcriptional regulator [Propionicimonas sp.]HRA07878.1 BlaI/MecI/CopY family transcriptional regulator [Propionicimonas sp.]